jgi:hypothetical protein
MVLDAQIPCQGALGQRIKVDYPPFHGLGFLGLADSS